MNAPPAQPIVVGVDGSRSALHAVRWAAREAERHGIPLRLVQVCALAPLGYPDPLVPTGDYADVLLEHGRRWLREAGDAARATAPAVEITIDLRAGIITKDLIEESATARMLVLGSRGLGGFAELRAGSIAVAVAAHAHCPVVVIRSSTQDGPAPWTGPVVVGVDGTPGGEPAVAFAFGEAAAYGRELIAVHTWTDTLLEAALVGYTGTLDFRPLQQQAYELLAERLAGWQEKYPQVKVAREVVHDRPAPALLRYAEGAALVVVGTRGRGGFRGLILGSTSQQLLHMPRARSR